jgi:RNA polymerase sigma-70 factor, ECF subfamily
MDKDQMIEYWFNHYADMVKSFLVYYTNSIDADDLVQDVFIKAYNQFESFQGHSHPKTWLISIARNAAIDQARRRSRLKGILEKFKGDSLIQRTPEEILLRNEVKRELYVKIKKLSSPQREVVILRGIMQLSIKETAEVVGVTEKQVSLIFHRALKKLKSDFGEGGPYFESYK